MQRDRAAIGIALVGGLTAAALAVGLLFAIERVGGLAERLEATEHALGVQEDISEIRKLQYAYNYYNSSRMYEQVLNLIADDADFIEIAGRGVYYGKEGFRKNFHPDADGNVHDKGMEFGNVLFQLAGQDIITVAPDRQSAKARVRVLTSIYFDFPDTRPRFNGGDYEMGYVKQDGKWKIDSLKYVHTFSVTYNPDGSVTPRYSRRPDGTADAPTTWYHPWPETGTLPFHFPNPITGEPSPEITGEENYWDSD